MVESTVRVHRIGKRCYSRANIGIGLCGVTMILVRRCIGSGRCSSEALCESILRGIRDIRVGKVGFINVRSGQ